MTKSKIAAKINTGWNLLNENGRFLCSIYELCPIFPPTGKEQAIWTYFTCAYVTWFYLVINEWRLTHRLFVLFFNTTCGSAKPRWAWGLQDCWHCCRTSWYSGRAERGDHGSGFLLKGPIWNSAGRGTSRTVVYVITERGSSRKEGEEERKKRETGRDWRIWQRQKVR